MNVFPPQLKQSLDFTYAYSTDTVRSCDTAITACITSKPKTSSLTGDTGANLGVTRSHFDPSKKPRVGAFLSLSIIRNRPSEVEA